MVTDTDGHNPRGWNAELRAERIELLQPSNELLQPERKCSCSPCSTCAGLGFNMAPTCVEQEPTSRRRGCAACSLQIQVDTLVYVGNSLQGPWQRLDLFAMLEDEDGTEVSTVALPCQRPWMSSNAGRAP